MKAETEVLVVGGGPGGYAAAFHAAELDLDVTLVVDEAPGGVCLRRGCIPSKALLHLTRLLLDTREAGAMGLTFEPPEIDLEQVHAWKDEVVGDLTGGLEALCEQHGVRLVKGHATFEAADKVRVEDSDTSAVTFDHAIIATGSEPIPLPDTSFEAGSRIMDAAAALELPDVPERLLVVGGGYIGLELGQVYAALGSAVTLVEMTGRLLPGTDPDLVEPLRERVEELFDALHVETKVSDLEETDEEVTVTLEGEETTEAMFDRVLVAIGRRPRTDELGLADLDVELDDDGFVLADEQQRTTTEHLFAVGDVAGEPLLAHKAMHEGRIAAEVIAGVASAFDARAIPAVIYTEPQVAWCGLTETEAKEQDVEVDVHRYPWQASGRAHTIGAAEGVTKLVLEPGTERVLGVGIAGCEAEALIAEGVLAVEMGAVAEDLARSIHPHPTLSETLGEAGELLLGGATHYAE